MRRKGDTEVKGAWTPAPPISNRLIPPACSAVRPRTNVALAEVPWFEYSTAMSESSSEEKPTRAASVFGAIGWLVRNAIALLFVAVAVASVYNVYGVGSEVEMMAKELACQGQSSPCTAQYTRYERRPWAHSFQMYTQPSSSERSIYCQPQYIFVGTWACKFNDQIAEQPPSSLPSASDKSAPAPSGSTRPAARPRTSAAPAATR
jgi:hypothetical protein